MTHTKDNICILDMPKGYQFRGLLTDIDPQGICFVKDRVNRCMVLPPGTWRFVALSTEMTEEKARDVVEAVDGNYRDYVLFRGHLHNVYDTALESFHSLLTALGCDPGGTYAVLKKTQA